MAEFWSSNLTEKSWNVLKEMSRKPFKFILIGGWAVYLWTKINKSKDIDIALINLKEIDYLKNNFELKKNSNLKKYEIILDEIDIDIYVPYFSIFPIPVENLIKYSTKIENLTVLKPEALLILKQQAELERKDSVKGVKDQIDILSLLILSEFDFNLYFKISKEYSLQHYPKRLKEIILNFKEFNYLNLNPRQFKLKKKELLQNLK